MFEVDSCTLDASEKIGPHLQLTYWYRRPEATCLIPGIGDWDKPAR
jgi:hypothetical protein